MIRWTKLGVRSASAGSHVVQRVWWRKVASRRPESLIAKHREHRQPWKKTRRQRWTHTRTRTHTALQYASKEKAQKTRGSATSVELRISFRRERGRPRRFVYCAGGEPRCRASTCDSIMWGVRAQSLRPKHTHTHTKRAGARGSAVEASVRHERTLRERKREETRRSQLGGREQTLRDEQATGILEHAKNMHIDDLSSDDESNEGAERRRRLFFPQSKRRERFSRARSLARAAAAGATWMACARRQQNGARAAALVRGLRPHRLRPRGRLRRVLSKSRTRKGRHVKGLGRTGVETLSSSRAPKRALVEKNRDGLLQR